MNGIASVRGEKTATINSRKNLRSNDRESGISIEKVEVRKRTVFWSKLDLNGCCLHIAEIFVILSTAENFFSSDLAIL